MKYKVLTAMRVEGKPFILIKTDVLIAYCARERRLIISKLNMCNYRNAQLNLTKWPFIFIL